MIRHVAAALITLASAAASGQEPQADLVLPSSLGPLTRVGGINGPIVASYVELPAGPGQPIATIYDRASGRTSAEDMAANEEPLRVLAGVTAPGEALSSSAVCPDLIGRVDRGRLNGVDTITASLFAVRNGRNIKLRVTAPATCGDDYIRVIVTAFRTEVLDC